jgi:GDPmannose 4,6-dehydratase
MICGDASKARAKLGWAPRVTFRELVRMMVEHDLGWRGGSACCGRAGFR